jgi:hypothetical protein
LSYLDPYFGDGGANVDFRVQLRVVITTRRLSVASTAIDHPSLGHNNNNNNSGSRILFSRPNGSYHDDKKKSTTDAHIETLLIVAKNILD